MKHALQKEAKQEDRRGRKAGVYECVSREPVGCIDLILNFDFRHTFRVIKTRRYGQLLAFPRSRRAVRSEIFIRWPNSAGPGPSRRRRFRLI